MNLLNKFKARYRRLETKYLDFHLGINAGPGETIRASDIVTDSPNKEHSKSVTSAQYRSIKVLIKEAVARGYQGAHFYDIGSGFGRVCFYTERTGIFSSVTGIEFSPALVDRSIAARNKKSADKPVFLRADAAEYKLNTQKNLIFMVNPFDDVVLKKFLDNNAAVLKHSAIAYSNLTLPDGHKVLLKQHAMECVWEDRNWGLSLWVGGK